MVTLAVLLPFPLLPIICTTLVALVGVVAFVGVGYLLTLLTAAVLSTKRRSTGPVVSQQEGQVADKIVIVVPAHDEEAVLATTLDSLNRQSYPADRYSVVVIADNCTDATAQIARDCGAIVLERFDTTLRGKGHALEWAFARLLGPQSPVDIPGDLVSTFVIVDADTWVTRDFLTLMSDHLHAEDVRNGGQGLAVLQGRYGVLNPESGWRAALMTGAFELVNHIRPLGMDSLNLSVGLKGNGMAFTRRVLEEASWQGSSITEDIDYGLDLLQHHGIRAAYAPEAKVLAQMPVTGSQAASQRERWERGRYRLAHERGPELIRQGLRRRNARLLIAGLDLIMPPLAELVGILILWGVLITVGASLSLLPFPQLWYGCLAAVSIGLVVYVLGGFSAAKAQPEAYLALLFAPFYVAWKCMLYVVGFVSRRLPGKGKANKGSGKDRQHEWVRTARIPVTPPTRSASSQEKADETVREKMPL